MADINVSTHDGLISAVLAANPGDRILLAAGNYGSVSFKDKLFTSDVTIMSADPANQAKIDMVTVTNSSHLVFSALEIGRPLMDGEANFAVFASFKAVSSVTFDGVFFHGSMDGNPGNDGNGLSVLNSSQITVKNSRFEQLGRGLMIGSSTDVLVQNSSFQNLRSDGMDFADIQRITIEGNKLRDFFPVLGMDHPDGIQFWTSGTTRASSDIVIRNNEIFQGTGSGTQGIFLRDQIGTLPYQNVSIENNMLYVYDGYNGIMVQGGANVSVKGNTVLSETTDGEKFWIRLEKVNGGVLQDNVSDGFVNVGNTNLTLTNNTFIDQNLAFSSNFRDINALALAKVDGLITTGIGYQPVGAAPAVVTTTTPPPTTTVVKPTRTPRGKKGAAIALEPVSTTETQKTLATTSTVVATESVSAFSLDAFLPSGLGSFGSVSNLIPVAAPAIPVAVAASKATTASAFTSAAAFASGGSFSYQPVVATSFATSASKTQFSLRDFPLVL